MSEAEPSVQYGAGQEDPRRSAATQQGSNPDEEQGKEKEDKGKKSGGNDKGNLYLQQLKLSFIKKSGAFKTLAVLP